MEKDGELKITEVEVNRLKAPATKEVGSVKKQPTKDKIHVQPLVLFPEEESPVLKQHPAHSDPLSQGKRPKSHEKTLVEIATGKKVLSSDVRLHLEKLQRQQKVDGKGETGKKSHWCDR